MMIGGSLVHARAEGISDLHPSGTEYDVNPEEYSWLTHSIAPVERLQTDARVEVGAESCS